MSAGLSSGDPANPKVLEGLQKIYAGIGDGSEFNGATPLTVMASMVAMRAGLSSGSQVTPGIIEGIQQIFAAVGNGSEFVNGVPKTISAGLTAIRAGLSSGNMQNPKIIEGLQQILAAIGNGNEFDPNTHLPKSLRASLNAIRAGLSSGDMNNPRIIEGLQTIYASLGLGSEFNGAVPLTLQAALVALQQGVGQLKGGAQLAHDAIGTGAASEFSSAGAPLTIQAALAALGSGLTQLNAGIGQIVTGLGDVDASGKPVKAVTTRVSKFGNTIESPATLLWGMQSAKDAVLQKFVVGVAQIVDALGDPNVTAATILSGLKQISDGLALAGGGATTGASGADTLSHIVGASVANQDVATALHQAGLNRVDSFLGFGTAGGDKHRTLFVFTQGGVA
jgi:X-X-X-Leu-X-X-Gly heptad repeat protein